MKTYIQTSLITVVLCLAAAAGTARDLPGKKPRLVDKSKAAGCAPASKIAELAFNNVRARIENGGNMWQNRTTGSSAYEVPINSGKRSMYSGALWMGGKTATGTIKLAAVLFRTTGNDFWPGPLTIDGSASVSEGTCENYNRFYKAFKSDAIKHRAYFEALENNTADKLFPEGYTMPSYFREWPAHGDPGQDPILAPFEDKDGDDIYEPDQGDYPGYDLFGNTPCRDLNRHVPLFGDTTIYWIFNDKGNIHTETGSEPIGMEIRAQAFAFADKNAINNMTFYNYVLINQGSETLDSTYFGQWADPDLGNSDDDYVGCDVSRGFGYCYNGDDDDDVTGGPSPGYGPTPPAIGIDFFQGPYQDNDGLDNPGPFDPIFAPFGLQNITYQAAFAGQGIPYRGLGIGYGDGVADNERFGMTRFIYHDRNTGPTGDPSTTNDFYNYLKGVWKDNSNLIYGGNGHQSTTGAPPLGADPTIPCRYMFPGESDSLGWGTEGRTGLPTWTEKTADNPPFDRRFMQSSGFFTLKPGQVNNITVGVVWARAEAGGALASVDELFRADDVAQGLFDNCFQIFEGPDAPDIEIAELDRELVLFLSNPPSSNNYLEQYQKDRPELVGVDDNTYRFEGYQIYQVKDATVSASELDDINRARLAFQVDVKNFNLGPNGKPNLSNPIAKLINYEFDPVMKLSVPVLKVNGSNQGIQNSFRVTQDLFADGADQKLVNNRPYYFIAIAYAYNNYQQFDPDPIQPKGQAEVYVPSRKNGRGGAITTYSAIPHKVGPEDGGTVINSEYGLTLPVTRLEGTGNGGFFVDMTRESEDAIMAGEPWVIQDIKYEEGAGPIAVKVVDPLRVQDADFQLRLIDTSIVSSKPYTSTVYLDNGFWELTNLTTGKVITSQRSIKSGGEQLVLDYGISIAIEQFDYSGTLAKETTDFLGAAKIPDLTWLTGFGDSDREDFTNWIRSGNVYSGAPFLDEDEHADEQENFENILGGTWAPYILTSDTTAGPRNQHLLTEAVSRSLRIASSNSIDIVITPDKSKWTRVPVIEMHEDNTLTEGFARKGFLRRAPSVDKNGLNATQPGYNAEEGNLVSATGMSWFPGYAISQETGERLNMSFGEDSWFVNDNGRDMIWNPTSNLYNNHPDYGGDSVVFGGRHYIFVHKNVQATSKGYNAKDVGSYDHGQALYTLLQSSTPTSTNSSDYNRFLSSQMWVGLPAIQPNAEFKSMAEGLVPSEVRIKLRVAKRYESYIAGGKTYDDIAESRNRYFSPMYSFSSKGYAVQENVTEVAKNSLDLIRVVPNPYYAYSEYEDGSRLISKVKITNLPEKCEISIFTVDGTLIRKFNRDTRGSAKAQTIQEWDLKNFSNIPIASGVYIVHINAPGLGEKVIKWFGVMRQIDLQNL